MVTSDLDADSSLRKLPKDRFSLHAQSFIKFEFIPVAELPQADWIFFASPRSVESVAESHNLKAYRIACLGPGTAKYLEKYGYSAHYVGAGSAEKAVADFADLHPLGKVVVPHGNQTMGTVTRVLPKERCSTLLTYKTASQSTQLEHLPDVAVFTSPSNVRSYLSNNDWPKLAGIAIGSTTFHAIKALKPPIPIHVAAEPTHEAIARLLFNRFAKR